MKTRKVWIVWTNSDTTEGRGYQYPIHICELKSTAQRLAKQKGVMGSNADVLAFYTILHNGQWLAPFKMEHASCEDVDKQKVLDAKEKAVEKAKSMGLTQEEILAIMEPTL